jgi:ribosomal protein S18 acetylase RimI-like enzyme
MTVLTAEDPVYETVSSDDWPTLKVLGEIERVAFADDALSPFNLSLLARCGELLIARVGGKVAAEVVAVPTLDPGRAFIFGLAVHPDFRRARLGFRLMERLIDRLRRRGFAEIELTVDPANEPAVRLYRDRLGFVVVAAANDLGPPARTPEGPPARLVLRRILRPDPEARGCREA